MLGDSQHGERRGGGPHDEMSLVPQGEFHKVRKLPVHHGEKDGVVMPRRAAPVGAVAENQAERIGGLMPSLALLRRIRAIGAKSLQA